MLELDNYKPQSQVSQDAMDQNEVVYDPNYPPFASTDPHSEANDIANEQFGDDLWRMEYSLRNEFIHAYGCECTACMDTFFSHKREYYDKTRVPDEDTGLDGRSLLHEQIQQHDKDWKSK